MAKLIYSALASLDGYIEDKEGMFDWAAPDEEVHQFIKDLERTAGTQMTPSCLPQGHAARSPSL